MAQSGDWVTPYLWGKPWFEKPALLYWMTALGFDAGLSRDLAPRLPLALLSLAFLAFYWRRLKHAWGSRAAGYATAMLATSAGWLTFSHVAVTDVPLAVFFSAAWLLSLEWMECGERRLLPAAAACLAAATLAKGLVPLVLFLPVAIIPAFSGGWRRLSDWLRPAPLLAFAVCALPWYVLVTLRNGREFLRVFFVEQHFSRFSSTALQHVQPWWFYVPVLLVLLFPWFPLLAWPSIAGREDLKRDVRVKVLVGVFLFGFLFFSASVNKLFGYLLPLAPVLFTLIGVRLKALNSPAKVVIAPLALIAVLPVAAEVAPRVMSAHGLRGMDITGGSGGALAVWMVAGGIAGALLARMLPRPAFSIAAATVGAAFLWFQFAAFPRLDQFGSARPMSASGALGCAPALPRDLLYGLYYYSGKEIPNCAVLDPTGNRVVR